MLADHNCPGGNIWIWTDDDGKPFMAKCSMCDQEIKVMLDVPSSPILHVVTEEERIQKIKSMAI